MTSVFSDKTIAARLLPTKLTSEEKSQIMSGRNCLLSKVKEYIDIVLNPAKVKFYDQSRDNYKELKLILEIFIELEISKTEYKNMLPTSNDNEFRVHLDL